MSNGFEFFEGTTTESANIPKITVRKGGILVLSRAAVEMLGDGATHAQIGYNPKTKAIGLRGATEDCKGCYLLRQQANSVSRLVDGKRVFALHGLTFDKARGYTAEDFGDGVVGFRLSDTGANEPAVEAAAKKNRRPAKPAA